MLVGALADTEPLYEQREASKGQTEDALVELLVREIEEALEVRPDAAPVGLGNPAPADRAVCGPGHPGAAHPAPGGGVPPRHPAALGPADPRHRQRAHPAARLR